MKKKNKKTPFRFLIDGKLVPVKFKHPLVIVNDIVFASDVDRTLVTVGHDQGEIVERKVKIKIHPRNVQSVKNHHVRGHFGVVWSRGGSRWAVDVVKRLKLEPYVDLIMCKFKWCLDDESPEKYLETYHSGEK